MFHKQLLLISMISVFSLSAMEKPNEKAETEEDRRQRITREYFLTKCFLEPYPQDLTLYKSLFHTNVWPYIKRTPNAETAEGAHEALTFTILADEGHKTLIKTVQEDHPDFNLEIHRQAKNRKYPTIDFLHIRKVSKRKC